VSRGTVLLVQDRKRIARTFETAEKAIFEELGGNHLAYDDQMISEHSREI
jgi:hypothetical protein